MRNVLRSSPRTLARKFGLSFLKTYYTPETIEPLLETNSVATFDIFDTLITRSIYYSSDVYVIAGAHLIRAGISDVAPEAWRVWRQTAEGSAAHNAFPDECSLDEIYEILCQQGVLVRENVARAQSIELYVEKYLSRPICRNISIINKRANANKSTFALSDTPLPHSEICELLKIHRIEIPSEAVFVSSKNRQTKRTGEAFKMLRRSYPQGMKASVHTGDNVMSDFIRPLMQGMSAVPNLLSKSSRSEVRLADVLSENMLLASAIAGAARSIRLQNKEVSKHSRNIWDAAANVIGPFLFSYTFWCLVQAKRRGIKRLYFLSRDGQILLEAAKIIAPHVGFEGELRYLLVSRKSLHFPALSKMNADEVSWILESAKTSSFQEILTKIHLRYDEVAEIIGENSVLAGMDPQARLTSQQIIEIEKIIVATPLKTKILGKARECRRLCIEYLRQEKFSDVGDIGIVDVGWRGRLQKSLCAILDDAGEDIRARLTGFYIDLTERPQESGQFVRFSDLLLEPKANWARRGPIFEIFCAATHGSVIGYSRTGRGDVKADLESERNADAMSWGLETMQQGVKEYCKEAVFNLGAVDVQNEDSMYDLAASGASVVRMFIEAPTRGEADAFGTFLHSEGEGHSKVEQIAPKILLSRMMRLGAQDENITRRISFWPEASIARTVPVVMGGIASYMFRYMPGRNKGEA